VAPAWGRGGHTLLTSSDATECGRWVPEMMGFMASHRSNVAHSMMTADIRNFHNLNSLGGVFDGVDERPDHLRERDEA